jgi:protein SCO1/2
MKDTWKLILTAVALFGIIIFSYQKNLIKAEIDPMTLHFNTSQGQKNLKNYQNKIVLMYFGFLTCPDACPTTMNHVSKAFKMLTPEEQEKVVFIFVDLDPKRDTIDKLNEYVGYFNKSFVTFSASEETTRPFARFFGVDYREVPLKSNMGYTIDHSTDIIVLNPQGKILDNIHHGTEATLMVATLRNLIKEYFTKDTK